jgi:ABC-2 type transport system permease protein
MRSVAEVNPVTQVMDAARQGFIGSVSWAETWPGVVALAALLALLGAWALREMRRTAA